MLRVNGLMGFVICVGGELVVWRLQGSDSSFFT